jgi:hypothetical protein
MMDLVFLVNIEIKSLVNVFNADYKTFVSHMIVPMYHTDDAAVGSCFFSYVHWHVSNRYKIVEKEIDGSSTAGTVLCPPTAYSGELYERFISRNRW